MFDHVHVVLRIRPMLRFPNVFTF